MRRTTDTAKRVFNFVGELANHLPARAVLNQQCVFPADLRASCDVGHFYEQCRGFDREWRHPTIDYSFMCVHFGWRQAHLVGVVIAAFYDAAQYVAQLGFVVDKLQKRFAVRACFADTQNIFRRRVESDDEQCAVEQDYASTQAVENVAGKVVEIAAAALAAAAAGRA